MGICSMTQGTQMYQTRGMGRDEGGREVHREGTYVYLWPIRVDVWQKPTQ